MMVVCEYVNKFHILFFFQLNSIFLKSASILTDVINKFIFKVHTAFLYMTIHYLIYNSSNGKEIIFTL